MPATPPLFCGGFVFALFGNPRNRDDFFILAGVKDLHATGAARPERNAINGTANGLALGCREHDLIFDLNREGGDNCPATHSFVDGLHAHAATSTDRIIV